MRRDEMIITICESLKKKYQKEVSDYTISLILTLAEANGMLPPLTETMEDSEFCLPDGTPLLRKTMKHRWDKIKESEE